MTDLRSTLERYVNMRQGLGYKFQRQAQRLADCVSFMEKRKAVTITTKLAVKWATLSPDCHASWVLRLAAVRGFARHIASLNLKTEMPPPGILPPLKRPKPYVYTNAEINALLAAALALPPTDGLRRWTYHCLFGLLAVTGLRLSEATGLQRDEVDLEAGVLTVRQSKFGKSRLVPLDLTACAPLRSYSERRDAHLGSRCGPHFFVAQSGGRLPQPSIRRVFMQLSHEIGLRRPGDRTGPRIHDFRHNSEHPIIPSGRREGAGSGGFLASLSALMVQDSITWTGARAPGVERRMSLAWRCSTEQVASDLNGEPMLPRRARRMDANLISRRVCWERA